MAAPEPASHVWLGTPLVDRGRGSAPAAAPARGRPARADDQIVTDAQGRRRFHGAFTGGFSAGHFNTVGSVEGWAPAAFQSSRGARAGARPAPSPADFMDDDEKEDAQDAGLTVAPAYDTFGGRGAAAATALAAADAAARPHAGEVPDLVPALVVAPVADSVGVRLLRLAGWKGGSGAVGGLPPLPPRPPPRRGDHGLGYDPHADAPEFGAAAAAARSARAAARSGGGALALARRPRGVAFGAGAFDDDDWDGVADDYVDDEGVVAGRGDGRARGALALAGGGGAPVSSRAAARLALASTHHFEAASDPESDGDGGRPGGTLRLGAAPARAALAATAHAGDDPPLPGCAHAVAPLTPPLRYEPPPVPPGFVAGAAAATARAAAFAATVAPPPRAASAHPPPTDPAAARAAALLAPYVARSGPALEALAVGRARAGDATLSFLVGGDGGAWFRARVADLRAASAADGASVIGRRAAPLTADERGVLLGAGGGEGRDGARVPAAAAPPPPASHRPAPAASIATGDRARLAASLASSFVASGGDGGGGGAAAAAPLGGLRPGAAPRAGPPPPPNATELSFAPASSAPAGGAGPLAPTRTVSEWRPAPLLCRRLNVPDPWKGRDGPVEERAGYRADAVALPETAAAAAAAAAAATAAALPPPPPLPLPPPLPTDQSAAVAADAFLESLQGGGAAPAPAPVPSSSAPAGPLPPPPSALPFQARPVDLFKAIFEAGGGGEGESDDEGHDRGATAAAPVGPPVPPPPPAVGPPPATDDALRAEIEAALAAARGRRDRGRGAEKEETRKREKRSKRRRRSRDRSRSRSPKERRGKRRE
jgi:G patch domain-containing protein 1